ncbi:hypothetical protein HZA39_03165 [Candidatus Peregrinibacteria bacterium]|nr:hypothetical protein [Candidatus Peregrinibacteria bacterium]
MENAAAINTKITDKILHDRFTQYGKNAREWLRKCALLLPEIEKREIWRKRGFPNIYEYARILAGMSANAVNDALRILKKAEDKPALQRVIEEKGINAVRPVIAIATSETASFWAEKAREMGKHTLEVYVKEFQKMQQQELEAAGWYIDKTQNNNQSIFRTGTENRQTQALFPEIKTETIQMEINPRTADELRKLKGSGNWDELMQKFIELYKEKLEAEKPEAVRSESRYVPVAIERHALAKTNNTCAFPGCNRPYEILHHTARFSLTHEHNPDALVPLCKAHEQLAHLGLIENEESAPSEWRVRTLRDSAYEKSEKFKIDQKVLKYRANTAPTASGA